MAVRGPRANIEKAFLKGFARTSAVPTRGNKIWKLGRQSTRLKQFAGSLVTKSWNGTTLAGNRELSDPPSSQPGYRHFDGGVSGGTGHQQRPQDEQHNGPARLLLENILLEPHQPNRQENHPHYEISLHLFPDASVDERARHHRHKNLKYAGLSLPQHIIQMAVPSLRRFQPQKQQRGQHVAGNRKPKSLGHRAHLRRGETFADRLKHQVNG